MRLAGTFTLGLFAALAGCGDGGGSSGGGGTPTPSAPTHAVGGSLSGLTGTGLSLKNGTDTLTITANGSFTLPTRLASGASYAVTVNTQPSGPVQNCVVQNGTGTVTSADVTTIIVSCTLSPSTYAYATVPSSAAARTTGLLEWFALDAATGRLTQQGKFTVDDKTLFDYVKPAPSGKQLLVSSRTATDSIRGEPLYRNDLTLYDLSPATGALSRPTLLANGGSEVIVHPNGVDLYTVVGNIYHFSLAPGTAQGQMVTLPPFAGSGAITPDGKFLFAPNTDKTAGAVPSIFVISLADPLRPALVATIPIASRPLTVTVSGNGRLLYVTPAAPGTLGQVYAIDAAGGLTSVGTFTAPTNGLSALVTGNFFYVASGEDDKVQGYRLDGAGGVTPLGSGTPVPDAFRLAIEPSGKYLYALSAPAVGRPAAIYGFVIAADGALTPVPGSPLVTGELEQDLAFVKANP